MLAGVGKRSSKARNQSDRLFRYDPRAKSFSSYPLPARVVFMRDGLLVDELVGGTVQQVAARLASLTTREG